MTSPHLNSATILTVNPGSSSVKLALYARADPSRRLASARVERIGLSDARMTVQLAGQDRVELQIDAPDHAAAVGQAIQAVRERLGPIDITAVGYRVVHGGPRYTQPQRVTAELMAELERISPLAPEHMPSAIAVIKAVSERLLPGVPAVACFDTAFHRTMPPVAKLLAIPRRYQAQGVERYGFHGLSYTYLIQELARQAGDAAAKGRVVLAHFGNGASLAAVRDGTGVDTSMGFTPAAGIPMGRRSGDLDPGLVRYLNQVEGMTPQRFDKMINHESGLLGVSETSPDMRDLLDRQATDPRAAEAVALFCYQAKKWVGSFAAALGGLDTLVFSGGIGENAPEVRARICEALEFLGIDIDPARNAANAPIISRDAGHVPVRVIPTDEERVIAETVNRIEKGLPT